MTHLMRLELKKVGLKKYVIFSMIGIFISMYFLFVGLNDSSTIKSNYETAFSTVGMIFCVYYITLFSVLVNALMMTVIKCTVKSRNRQFARHSKRETLFCELSDMKIFEQGTEDNYFCNYIPFKVLNYTIQVSNEKLANALYKLSDKEREVILVHDFQSMRDKEITDLYQVSRSAIYRRRSNGLKKLKTLLKERN